MLYYQPDTSTLSSGQNVRYYIDPFINYFTKAGDKHSFKSRIYHVDNLVSGGKSNSSTSGMVNTNIKSNSKGRILC